MRWSSRQDSEQIHEPSERVHVPSVAQVGDGVRHQSMVLSSRSNQRTEQPQQDATSSQTGTAEAEERSRPSNVLVNTSHVRQKRTSQTAVPSGLVCT
jgi:hypothetical protein